MDGCSVKLRKNEDQETLFRRFSRKVKKSGILDDFHEKRYHKKGSEKKREKHYRKLAIIKKLNAKRRQEERNY